MRFYTASFYSFSYLSQVTYFEQDHDDRWFHEQQGRDLERKSRNAWLFSGHRYICSNRRNYSRYFLVNLQGAFLSYFYIQVAPYYLNQKALHLLHWGVSYLSTFTSSAVQHWSNPALITTGVAQRSKTPWCLVCIAPWAPWRLRCNRQASLAWAATEADEASNQACCSLVASFYCN